MVEVDLLPIVAQRMLFANIQTPAIGNPYPVGVEKRIGCVEVVDLGHIAEQSVEFLCFKTRSGPKNRVESRQLDVAPSLLNEPVDVVYFKTGLGFKFLDDLAFKRLPDGLIGEIE